MVLRRPYAFLIKHFRLIHIIIAAMLIYLAIRCRGVYRYLNLVIVNSTNRYGVLEYTRYGLIAIIVLAILLFFAVFWLLKYKDKPRRLYIISMVGYAIVGIFLIVLFTYMNSFLSNVAEVKTIRLYRDILFIVQLFQYIMIVFMIIRGLGFDIKKFDFNRDAQELNALESDSEEIEINTKIDTTNIVRGINKGQRELGYYLKEFRIYVLVVLAVVLLILGIKAYNFFTDKLKVYGEDQYVGTTKKLKVVDSYYSETNGKKYVIVSIDIYKQGKREQFNINGMTLKSGRNKYLPDKTVCSKFSKLGTCYKQQYISSNVSNYIIVYEVDKLKTNKSYIIYKDSYDTSYKIKLDMKEA